MGVSALMDEVRATHGAIMIPTYPWGPDDIYPHFRQLDKSPPAKVRTIYPYPMQDTLSSTCQERGFKTLVLENRYLKLTVIPELGGRVHSLKDKITGADVVYEARAIKPGMMGARGAWAGGGIEFNSGPKYHTVTNLSPVDARFVEYADGSGAIVIGNVDLIHGLQWGVTLRLRPGRSYLEERVGIHNPTGNRHPYCFWTNVAVPSSPRRQLVIPAKSMRGEEAGDCISWPPHGSDRLTFIGAFRRTATIYALQCDQDFFGTYDHELDCGLVSYADHRDLPGKKAWTAGQDTLGRCVMKQISDDPAGYDEIQTGPQVTPEDQKFLDPHQCVQWLEYWYPIRGTGGLACANRDVAVNVLPGPSRQGLTILVHGTGSWDARIRVRGIGEEPVTLSPQRAASVTFPIPAFRGPFEISIDVAGEGLARFEFPLRLPERPRPQLVTPSADPESAEALLRKGREADGQGVPHLARRFLEAAIRRDPGLAAAHAALGELDLDAGRCDAARSHLEESLNLEPANGMAAYFLAEACVEQDGHEQAMDYARRAARDPHWTSAAFGLMGRVQIKQQDLGTALSYLRSSLKGAPRNLVARNLTALALWKNGDRAAAIGELEIIEQMAPLDIPKDVIGDLMGARPKAALDRIRGRTQHVLHAADFFLNAGLIDEAAWIVRHYYLEPGETTREPHPMPYYFHGILADDAESLDRATQLGPDYVFPNRRSELRILEAVHRKRPDDWKPLLYLGNGYFERGRSEEAVRAWTRAADLHAPYSVVYRNLGLVAWKLNGDVGAAIQHYERALALRPSDLILCRDLAMLYARSGRVDDAVDLLERTLESEQRRVDVTFLLASLYGMSGRFEKAKALLLTHRFGSFEGQFALRDVYARVCIAMGERLCRQERWSEALRQFKASLRYSANPAVGRPEGGAQAESRYWIGVTLQSMGRQHQAVRAWKKAAQNVASGDPRCRTYAQRSLSRLRDQTTWKVQGLEPRRAARGSG